MIVDYTSAKEVVERLKDLSPAQKIGVLYQSRRGFDVVIYRSPLFIAKVGDISKSPYGDGNDAFEIPYTPNADVYNLIGYILGDMGSITNDVNIMNEIRCSMLDQVYTTITRAFPTEIHNKLVEDGHDFRAMAKHIYELGIEAGKSQGSPESIIPYLCEKAANSFTREYRKKAILEYKNETNIDVVIDAIKRAACAEKELDDLDKAAKLEESAKEEPTMALYEEEEEEPVRTKKKVKLTPRYRNDALSGNMTKKDE